MRGGRGDAGTDERYPVAVTDDSGRATEGETVSVGNGTIRAGGTVGAVAWGLCSEPGPVRTHNEDFAGASVPVAGDGVGRREPLFALADGLGGHAAGEVASRTAIETMLARWAAGGNDDAAKALRACARDANTAVVTASYEKGRAGMGSTLTALALSGREALIVHVGDSRAYLVRGDSCTQLTNDHSRVGEMLRMKLITPERAATHPARSQLTRSLGATLSLQVDLVRRPVEPGDTFVLCSDGLWDEVARAEIQLLVEGIDEGVTDAAGAASSLVGMAVDRGAADNVTAVVVRLLDHQDVTAADQRRSRFRRRR